MAAFYCNRFCIYAHDVKNCLLHCVFFRNLVAFYLHPWPASFIISCQVQLNSAQPVSEISENAQPANTTGNTQINCPQSRLKHINLEGEEEMPVPTPNCNRKEILQISPQRRWLLTVNGTCFVNVQSLTWMFVLYIARRTRVAEDWSFYSERLRDNPSEMLADKKADILNVVTCLLLVKCCWRLQLHIKKNRWMFPWIKG